MPLIHETVRRYGRKLDSRFEAELLVAEGLGRSRAWLYAHADEEMPPCLQDSVEALVRRRLSGEPIAYILGAREFYGRDFLVSPAVLIPRPETELLVDLALQRLPASEKCRLVDVGTGSGCIALSLAAERPDWEVTAVDLSTAALRVCAANAHSLDLQRVRRLESDLLDALAEERFDAIVSNPPYVAANDPHLTRGDLRFEPHQALSAGSDGLGIIRRLVEQAQRTLAVDGWLILEHGHDQGRQVRELMDQSGMVQTATHMDLAGIDRVTLAQRSR